MFNFAKHINRFLDGIQRDTQKRFIKQAKKKGSLEPKKITRLTKIEKEVEELKKILKDL